jgi:hypothetical protein
LLAPDTIVVEKFWLLPVQTVELPVIVTGCEGILVIVMARVRALLVPQLLFAVIEIFPLAVPVMAVIEYVPDVPDHPEGNVQVYPVAPGTAVTEKVCETPPHKEELPEITPGCAGAGLCTVTARLWFELEPQLLFDLTVIVPPVDPGVTGIEFAVEAPVHPEGRVHI